MYPRRSRVRREILTSNAEEEIVGLSVVPVNKQFQRLKTVFDWLITVYFLTVN